MRGNLQKRVIGRFDKAEDKTAAIEVPDVYDDQIPPGELRVSSLGA